MAVLSFKEILELIDKVADRKIAVLEIESGGVRLRIEGMSAAPMPSLAHPAAGYVTPAQTSQANLSSASGTNPAHPARPASAGEDEESIEPSWHIVTSPIVGTFYLSPNPESESFVSVGARVTKGSVLCIVEAMKLMNEIESDVDGIVMKIFPQNGQPIEYGEKLFAIKV